MMTLKHWCIYKKVIPFIHLPTNFVPPQYFYKFKILSLNKFSASSQLYVNKLLINLLMTGFEPVSSIAERVLRAKCAITTAKKVFK